MKGKSAAIILVLLFQSAGMAWGGLDDFRLPPLEGLKEVYVLVEDLDPIAEKHGLTRSVLQTDAELKLRLAGIKVVDPDSKERFSASKLYMNIASMVVEIGEKDIGFAYCVIIELKEYAHLSPEYQKGIAEKNADLAAGWYREGKGRS